MRSVGRQKREGGQRKVSVPTRGNGTGTVRMKLCFGQKEMKKRRVKGVGKRTTLNDHL